MVNHTGIAFGAGPSYTNAIMGQGPSAAERDHARKASTTILREDSIQVEQSDNISLADSWSMHFDCMSQARYCSTDNGDMVARKEVLGMGQANECYDLALFLNESGPKPLHRRPSKVASSSRSTVKSTRPLHFLKLRLKKKEQACVELRDEGGLLRLRAQQSIPKGYQQKVSSAGQKYLALQEPRQTIAKSLDQSAPMEPRQTAAIHVEPLVSPSITESRVSIYFTDDIQPTVDSDDSRHETGGKRKRDTAYPIQRWSYDCAFPDEEVMVGAMDESALPIRPPASDPPTPEPMSATSFSGSFNSDITEQPARHSMEFLEGVTNTTMYSLTSSSLPLPRALDNIGASPNYQIFTQKKVEIEHPLPQRLASHTALLQRSSTISSIGRRLSDSPDLPPRSPLRPKRDTKNIEDIITSYDYERPTSKVAPTIPDVKRLRNGVSPIRPIVVTQCTGPLTPSSEVRKKSPLPVLRAERDKQTRARKLRDRPATNFSAPIQVPAKTIDAIVQAPMPEQRQRLRKARPQIQIPDLRPPPLAPRASFSTSSSASWKKVTETTKTPVSVVPSVDTPTTTGEKTGYTPISPTASYGSAGAETTMALSPVMLVAEEVPIPKAKSPPKPTRLVVKEGKVYAPRPRSASIPRSAMKRRSRYGVQTPSRPGSPKPEYVEDEAPPLPSPPPNRALPPTPPASGSEGPGATNAADTSEREKELPHLPSSKIISKLKDSAPHIASQAQGSKRHSGGTHATDAIHQRLEALEKQNALLSAALTAVLQSNGASNGPIHNIVAPQVHRPPAAWQIRIERRSKTGHASNKSNDSAMRLYHNTRRHV